MEESRRILVIEDEVKVAESLKRGLNESGFEVEVGFDGNMGQKLFNNYEFDLIVLDINLPHVNGFELAKRFRTAKPRIPILMLTALGTTSDKLEGFDAGADDYMVKPFEFSELLARIRSLLRRSGGSEMTGSKLVIADLEIDIDSKVVKRGGKKISLTAKEYLLLEYLVRNKGKVISRATIAEKIWDLTFDTGTNVIDVYVNFLRKKIDKDFSPKLIHTYIGMGYILKEGDE